LKDKGRRHHTLISAIPGPRSGVHFKRGRHVPILRARQSSHELRAPQHNKHGRTYHRTPLATEGPTSSPIDPSLETIRIAGEHLANCLLDRPVAARCRQVGNAPLSRFATIPPKCRRNGTNLLCWIEISLRSLWGGSGRKRNIPSRTNETTARHGAIRPRFAGNV
jgi:hypothetical protein